MMGFKAGNKNCIQTFDVGLSEQWWDLKLNRDDIFWSWTFVLANNDGI